MLYCPKQKLAQGRNTCAFLRAQAVICTTATLFFRFTYISYIFQEHFQKEEEEVRELSSSIDKVKITS